MDVYVKYSEGRWRAYAVDTNTLVASAILYNVLRANLKSLGHYVTYVYQR